MLVKKYEVASVNPVTGSFDHAGTFDTEEEMTAFMDANKRESFVSRVVMREADESTETTE